MATKTKKRGRPVVQQVTAGQRRVLRAIEKHVRQHRYPPTFQELGDELGISAPSVYGFIKQLERKGYVKRDPNKARGLTLIRRAQDAVAELVTIPIVGRVAAGKPLLADENVTGEIHVEASLGRAGDLFALEVTGDSMKRAKIRDGDLVIVHLQPLAENGDIVVALVDGEATVKRLAIDGHNIELRPENSRYRPIPIGPHTDLRVIGKVVAVRRIS